MSVTANGVIEAAIAVLNAALTGSSEAYLAYSSDELEKLDKAGGRPTTYLEVSAQRRYTDQLRKDPGRDKTTWWVDVEAVSTAKFNADAALDRAHDVLDHIRLTVDSTESTLLDPTPGRPVDKDDRDWSGLDSWSCVF